MTGELYLLNALWLGALLVILARIGPALLWWIGRIVVLCLPFGLVAGFHVVQSIIDLVKRERDKSSDKT